MRKKALVALLESMVLDIVRKHGGTVEEDGTITGGAFDGDGARALLGAALRANREALVSYGVGTPMAKAAAELQEVGA